LISGFFRIVPVALQGASSSTTGNLPRNGGSRPSATTSRELLPANGFRREIETSLLVTRTPRVFM
jgi:hypothetical protein